MRFRKGQSRAVQTFEPLGGLRGLDNVEFGGVQGCANLGFLCRPGTLTARIVNCQPVTY